MAISFIAAGTKYQNAGGSSGTASPTLPSGGSAPAADDLIIAAFFMRRQSGWGSGSWTTPTGFTLLGSIDAWSVFGCAAIFYKVATGSDASPSSDWSGGSTSTNAVLAQTYVFRGVDPTTPVLNDGGWGHASPSDPSAPGMTPNAGTGWVVAWHGQDNDATVNSSPSGWTARDRTDTLSGSDAGMSLATLAWSSGAVADAAWDTSGTTAWNAIMFALKELSADVTVTPGTASLTTTKYAPKANKALKTASPTALVLTGYASQLIKVIKASSPLALTTTKYAPKANLAIRAASPSTLSTAGQAPSLLLTLKPDSAALATVSYEPTVRAGVTLMPDAATLALTTYAVSLALVVEPSVGALALAGLAPDVNIALVVTPDSASLTTSPYASTLLLAIKLPSPTSLTTELFAPQVPLVPAPASVATTGYGPKLLLDVKPGALALTISLLTPDVRIAVVARPSAASLVTELFAPSFPFVPEPAALVIATFAPTLIIPAYSRLVIPAGQVLRIQRPPGGMTGVLQPPQPGGSVRGNLLPGSGNGGGQPPPSGGSVRGRRPSW